MYQLIIFDFDDTLVDNSSIDYMGFKIPCKILNIQYPSKSELNVFRKKGLVAKEIIQIYSNIDNQTLTKFLTLRKKFLLKESINYLKIKPNTKLLLRRLEKANLKLIICSANNNKKLIDNFLKQNKLRTFFEQIYVINNLKIKLENNNHSNRILIKTSLIRLAIKQHQISTKNILYIGNSLEDQISAIESNIKFIYFINKYLPNPRISGLKKISNMKNLQKIILGESR
jgi:phosphoglycolate phosphatase-like HAD superfamily hydrolase